MEITPNFAQDLMEDDNEDIYIDPNLGDFVIMPSDDNHIQDILQCRPGDYKLHPAVGCAIQELLKARVTPQGIEGLIKPQLEADGYRVQRPEITISPLGETIIKPNARRIR